LERRGRIPEERTIGKPYVAALSPLGLFGKLAEALAEDLAAAGVDRDSILTEARVGLGGGYGLTSRSWDLVVLNEDLPVIVVEIKVILGSSLKNLRNRLDDIVAAATNISRTFDGPDRSPYKPCIAVVFVMEETLATTTPRAAHPVSHLFPGDTQPEPTSYIELVGTSFSRMLADGLLDAVCYLIVETSTSTVSEPFPDQSFDAFTSKILEHITAASQGHTSGALSAASLGRVLSRGDDVEEVIAGLTSTPEGLSAAEGAVIRERRRIVADLQQLALDPETNETKMHQAMGERYWIFGGQYVGIADRRSIAPLDQYDIPLICGDGSLEIVELKGPEVNLVRKYRNHLIVAHEVHQAVNQCLNYLRALDEMGAALRTQYHNEFNTDFDFRRARGTVVIGHPGRDSSAEATREQVDQTIRSYNAHLSRLTVLTYADLLESAERALQFASDESSTPSSRR